MTVKSNIGQVGDRVTLLSPIKTFQRGTHLGFYYHMRISDEDRAAALSLFTYTKMHVYERRLAKFQGNHGTDWQWAKVCLPEGTYQIAFVATHGLPFYSDISLDEIALWISIYEYSCDYENEGKYL